MFHSLILATTTAIAEIHFKKNWIITFLLPAVSECKRHHHDQMVQTPLNPAQADTDLWVQLASKCPVFHLQKSSSFSKIYNY